MRYFDLRIGGETLISAKKNGFEVDRHDETHASRNLAQATPQIQLILNDEATGHSQLVKKKSFTRRIARAGERVMRALPRA
jgi:hypothetical protein